MLHNLYAKIDCYVSSITFKLTFTLTETLSERSGLEGK